MAHNDRTLTYHLNRVAGLLVNDQPTRDDAYAACAYAGIALQSLETVGALNFKAGIVDRLKYLELAGVLNLLAGTRDLAVDEAASYLP
jgi:hypothetical protein